MFFVVQTKTNKVLIFDMLITVGTHRVIKNENIVFQTPLVRMDFIIHKVI